MNGKTRGKLIVSGNTRKARKLTATLGKRENLATRTQVPCWMVQRNGRKLLDGNYMDYINRPSNADYTVRRRKNGELVAK